MKLTTQEIRIPAPNTGGGHVSQVGGETTPESAIEAFTAAETPSPYCNNQRYVELESNVPVEEKMKPYIDMIKTLSPLESLSTIQTNTITPTF